MQIVCNQFERKQEAEDWALSVEQQIRQGQFKFERHNVQRTFSELVDHFVQSGALEHHRSAKDTVRHLEYWKTRIGDYALVHLTPERLGKERQLLIDTPTHKSTKRSSATVNRYIASLSAALTYSCRQLRWIDDNPCFNLIKLKEAPGRDRVLTEDETEKLLEICRESRHSYLYCIVLMAFTTGMRQGEILGLTWNQIDVENQMAHLKETKNESVDAVIMSTVLCCMIDSNEQEKLIEEIFRVLKNKGVLYLSDFLICDDERYKEKYSEGFQSFGTWGVYTTSENLTVRHLTTQSGLKLLQNFDIQWFEQFDFKTMNQNPARTFHCIGVKHLQKNFKSDRG